MLAFDIETTGIDMSVNHITTACIYDPQAQICKTFIFPLGDSPEEFMQYLDKAESLCAFNGAQFDIPFIQKQWNVHPGRVFSWRCKLYDLYDMCMQVFQRGFSLNMLLSKNHLASKTGTGKEAIELANEGRWKELGEYCMQDTQKTYMVSNLPDIVIPIQTGESDMSVF